MKPLDPAVGPSLPELDVHLGTIAASPYHPRSHQPEEESCRYWK
jgi:hypothetical protein